MENIINHSKYGSIKIDTVWPLGVTFEILSEKGKQLFRMERNGYLPRCYETSQQFNQSTNHYLEKLKVEVAKDSDDAYYVFIGNNTVFVSMEFYLESEFKTDHYIEIK